ncbi:MAG: PAS-domain containing protein [Wenzhouxiangellaceae bacterium]|nr:PAS-domain containing protein [Wenzhouxiangellaceae bacterium]MBS3822433.1 PAS-domain containing protein [Wenzhouxiangellaceae bacterium]
MFSPQFIALIALAYVGLLFALAWIGDRLPQDRLSGRTRTVVYSLSLAVYCTSWTFFGAVGSAAADGWLFATIYIGPILVLVLGHDLMHRILKLSREQRLTSIADFIAHRFGKSRPLAVLVTLAAVLGAIPYIALQLKAVTNGVVIITDEPQRLSQSSLALVLAMALGAFSILFGARRLEASEHHRGMVLAVAFESLVKLLAFGAVALWALYALLDGPGGLVRTIAGNADYRELFMPDRLPGGFWVQTLLGAAAILCLPRQFQVTFVENERTDDLNAARWLFPAYLLGFTLLVVPITVAGLQRFAGQSANADMFMLSLPMSADLPLLTLLSFVGGFSAATGMVIVATVALATMVSNDLIAPLLMQLKIHRSRDFGRLLLHTRRVTILVLAALSWLYYLALPSADALASIGLMAFAAVIQFAPALVFGVYWRRASREGVMAGLMLGLGSWLSLIFVPSIVSAWPEWGRSNLNDAVLLGLSLNIAALVSISLWVRRRRPTLPMLLGRRDSLRPVTVGELRRLAMSFIGRERVDLAFANAMDLGPETGFEKIEAKPANAELVGFTERLLAGCIGSASARTVLTAGLRRSGMDADEALALLEQTSSAIQFNRDLLEATLDHISQGVSVVDADLRLVSWNRAYVELLGYPPGMVYLGRPVEELIRFNLEREQRGSRAEIESAIDRRMHHMRRGTSYLYERRHGDGRVIEIRGNPMPRGGYVTTYTDITSFKQNETELKSAYETMEQQVNKRTRELRATMQALEIAKHDAEQANRSKTRFLAAASHDLLQPLNAARLFSANLGQSIDRLPPEEGRLVRRMDHSLGVAEELLSALLDISRLDQGALQPKWTRVSAAKLLDKVERQFSALAERRDLRLRVRACRRHVRADARLLQRVLFNLVNNALRYTRAGGVLVGCRVRGSVLRFEVWDTGPGIVPDEQERIFEEFERLAGDAEEPEFDQGLGLGLSICRRICRMLEAPLELKSRPGAGSLFVVSLRLDDGDGHPAQTAENAPTARSPSSFEGMEVLCLDDDREILDGMQMLLERWGCRVRIAANRSDALDAVGEETGLIIADYHLGGGDDGVSASAELRRAAGREIPVLILTADREDELGDLLEALGYQRLFKPVKPAALRALMRHLVASRPG